MAFETVVQLQGDDRKFKLSPEIKQFTLLDLGFSKQNNGSFVLKQPISGANLNGYKLKISVNKDLDQLKMVVTDGKGLRKIDIFKNNQHPDDVEQLNFFLQTLILRKVLTPAN
ncbi:hypothetical protein [Nicoliella lavandulae]|uniref:Cysteine desulfurase n=1 Tax=Nicoliella lavandulae TaxID=3082954 RepID=A0ABU8SLN0_9LACO